MSQVICIIPARNEACRVENVVRVAVASPLITGGVWVVDNGSTDQTAEAARSAGANVLSCVALGKGNAVGYAVNHLCGPDDVVLLLDADLRGLSVEHIEQLVLPVTSRRYVQSVGVRDGGSMWRKFYWRFHVGLSGQRAFRASLLWEIYELDYQGWALEVALNSICRWSPKRRKRQIAKSFLKDLDEYSKAEKYDSQVLVSTARRAVFVGWLKGLIRFNLGISKKHWLQ